MLLGNPLFLLFTAISLFYAWQAFRLLRQIWQRRAELRQEPLRPWQKQLAEQAAFLVAIPPGVVIHELGHALAIWLFGGQVVEFGFWLYWGYVVPQGRFAPEQEWFISLAGTLGTLAYAGLLALLLKRRQSSASRFFILRAFRFQIYYALVYYPIFTAVSFVGDWRVIYDFEATPLLSGFTAVLHAALLILFWLEDRQGRFEMASHESVEAQQQMGWLRAEVAHAPHDEQLHLMLIDRLRMGGAQNQARVQLKRFLKQHPDSAEGHLQLATLQSYNKRQIPRQASHNYRRALDLGLDEATNAAYAHQQLGQYNLDLNRLDAARNHFDDGLTALNNDGGERAYRLRAHLYYLRATTHRRQGQHQAAASDIEAAIEQAEAGNNKEAAAYYRQELEIARQQAGRR